MPPGVRQNPPLQCTFESADHPGPCTCSNNVVHAPSLARMCFFEPSRVAGQRTTLESESSVSSVGQSTDKSHQVPVIQSFDQRLLDAGIRRISDKLAAAEARRKASEAHPLHLA